MKTLVRAATVAVMLVLATVGFGLPAGAATGDPSPTASLGCGETDDYGAQGVCQVQVVASAVCVGDVPYLEYTLTPTGTSATTATITFDNPNGADVVLTDQPLTGTVMWPGAAADANGNATDWPGWTKGSDGTWVQGDDYDWATGATSVTFEVNPSATVTVVYAAATSACSAPPTSVVLAAEDPAAAVLSATGSNVAPLLFAGAGLVGLGGLLLLARAALRRRKVTTA